MSSTTASTNQQVNSDKVRRDWLARLSDLIDHVESWADELGWATRRIQKRMADSQIGTYDAPALLLQKEISRVLLEPIARSAPGAEGVVDLYLMPAYDDIATLYYVDGGWQLHYMFSGSPRAAAIEEADFKPFSKDILRDALEDMRAHTA